MVGTALCGRICYPETEDKAGIEAAYEATFKLWPDNWCFTFNAAFDTTAFKKYPDDAPAFIKDFEKTIPPSDWDLMEKFDFMGVNIYNGVPVDRSGKPAGFPAGHPKNPLKWPVSPKSMQYGIEFLYRRYGLPIVITENGQSCNDLVFLDGQVHDPARIDFLHRYLLALKDAMDNGADVRGYLHWSFLDNFEWAKGYDERFGLVYVDYATQKRILKDSAQWYADVIQSNGGTL